MFTGGGTESDNAAIVGVATALQETGNHVITSSVEHHAVLHSCQHLESHGFEATYLPVDSDGIVQPDVVYNAITGRTTLVSVMYANNEIGAVNPIPEISQAVRQRAAELSRTIVFHTDAVQAAGYLDLDVRRLGGGPAQPLGPQVPRPPRVPACCSCDEAPPSCPSSSAAARNGSAAPAPRTSPASWAFPWPSKPPTRSVMRTAATAPPFADRIVEQVLERVPNSKLNGHPTLRLPNNANFSFAGIEGEPILLGLDMAGIAASSGSACSSGSLEPSHVLLALGQSAEVARGSLRLTLGKDNTEEQVDYLLEVLPDLVERLRRLPSLTTAGS